MSDLNLVSSVMYESNGIYFIGCEGCKMLHPIHVGDQHKVKWSFNGNLEKPTFSPSLLVYGDGNQTKCHSFITDGKIQFLSDCRHYLAGKTVDLKDPRIYWE